MFTKGVNKATAYYAPKKKNAPPESELDGYSLCVKAIVVATCVIIEIACYCILLWYYDQDCSSHYGASTCSYAIDKEWNDYIFNTDGLRWIECYDTSGAALGTTLTEAQAANSGDDDGAAYKDIRACSAFKSNSGEVYDDDKFYNSDNCCDGWFHEGDSCVVADFCYNSLLMCEWLTCPTPMEVYGLANGAMTGIHVAFFYIIVTAVLYCLVRNKRPLYKEGAAPTQSNV